ncbi:DUF6497 family protein [Paracoccus broussonetiae]|uniref:DUF6497 family protein n=1 Tax=Paracoccus broussonetiae subsp. drimophilus TaxID=3373869 RepID=A0ABW7LGS0_9RHOB
MTRPAAVCASLALLALPAAAEIKGDANEAIRLPSGAVAYWQETLHDSAGGTGLTYRFRFVMPDLAARVPSTEGSATEPDDADRAPIEIDTETAEVQGGDGSDADANGAGEYLDDRSVEIGAATPDADPAAADVQAEEDADAMVDEPALPAAPDALAQDPVHDDVVWLCENWVLPRIASPGPRPTQIIVSLADKKISFGTYDPDVLQLFEAFRLPADRNACEWEPW